MGLEEKRAMAKVKSQFIPDFEGRIQEVTGFPVKLDLDWDSFGEDKALLEASESGFFTVMTALKSVCADDLGRDLAKQAIREVRLANGPFSASLGDGVVCVHLPNGGGASVGFSPQLAAAIGDGL
jgi:hypothetical protein